MGMNPFSFVCRERECVSERERGVCVCVCVCVGVDRNRNRTTDNRKLARSAPFKHSRLSSKTA